MRRRYLSPLPTQTTLAYSHIIVFTRMLPHISQTRPKFSIWLSLEHHVASMLPFSRWLDYCSIGYFVTAGTAKRQMSDVLAMLRDLGPRQFLLKQASAKVVRDAFFYKSAYRHLAATGQARLSAEDFVLGEICHRASLYNRAANASLPAGILADATGMVDAQAVGSATQLGTCLLWPG